MPKGLPPPNHTQTPNIFFDSALPQIKSLAELKVILVVTRQTFGWHKAKDRLSISRLQKLTGLTRQGVVSGTERAIADGFIAREADGDSFSYSLVVVNDLDYPAPQAGQPNGLAVVNEVDQKVVNDLDTQKKVIKETNTKEIKTPSAHAGLMDFLSTRLGHLPNGGQQGKSVKWLLERYDPVECFGCFNFLAEQAWRSTPVTWSTVQSNIGDWLKKHPVSINGTQPLIPAMPLPTGVRTWNCTGCAFTVMQNGNGITSCPDCKAVLT